MKDFIAAFREKSYEPLAGVLLHDTDSYFAARQEEVKKELFECLEKFISAAVQKQKEEGLPPPAYLTLSVLYTSVYFGKPQLLLEFYDESWMLGKAIYAETADAGWLFRFWEEHQKKLADAEAASGAFVRPSHTKQMEYQSVYILSYLAATRMKYWLAQPEEIEAFAKLEKQPQFYITCGEYLGWQNTVAAVLPEIDIFNCDEEESLTLRTFYHCKYENKKFEEIDLRGSRFYQCSFNHCSFTQVLLCDTLFDACTMRDVSFFGGQILGATLKNTLLKDVRFYGVTAGLDKPNPKEWYKAVEFIDCSLHNILLEDCQFQGCVLNACVAERLTIRGGNCQESDFLPWLGENDEEAGEA